MVESAQVAKLRHLYNRCTTNRKYQLSQLVFYHFFFKRKRLEIFEQENFKKYVNGRKRRLEKTSHESSLFEMFMGGKIIKYQRVIGKIQSKF